MHIHTSPCNGMGSNWCVPSKRTYPSPFPSDFLLRCMVVRPLASDQRDPFPLVREGLGTWVRESGGACSQAHKMCPTHLRRRCRIFLTKLKFVVAGLTSWGMESPVNLTNMRLFVPLMILIVCRSRFHVSQPNVITDHRAYWGFIQS